MTRCHPTRPTTRRWRASSATTTRCPAPAPRRDDIGPFTLFVSTGMWPYYARPRLGLDRAVRADDVTAVRERQARSGVARDVRMGGRDDAVDERRPPARPVSRSMNCRSWCSTARCPLAGRPRTCPSAGSVPTNSTCRGSSPSRRSRSRTAARRSGRSGPRERDAKAAADPIVPPRLRDRIRSGPDGPLRRRGRRRADRVGCVTSPSTA